MRRLSVSEENSNESVEDVNESVAEPVAEEANAVSKVMDLKESNPKVFFGAIAGLVVVILVMFMGGGSNNAVQQHRQVDLTIGNTYTLKGINTFSDDAKVRLVAVPGSLAAYDESEEEGATRDDCKYIAQGEKVKLLQMQDALGGAKFVEVELLNAGKCAGRTGWATAGNLN